MWDSIDFSHGSHGLLISVAVLLFLNLFGFMAKFIFDNIRKKAEFSQKHMILLNDSLNKASASMDKLTIRIEALERDFKDIEKMKADQKRLYLIMKHIAKDDWQEIKRLFFDDEL